MNNYIDETDIPLGLGMALSKNIEAMNCFANQTKEKQKQIIKQAHDVRSKEEMAEYVASIARKECL